MQDKAKNIEKYLEEIRKHFHEYNCLANQLTAHYQDENFLQHLFTLEKEVLILKQNLENLNLDEHNRQQKFLEHHLNIIQLINQQMNHLRNKLSYSFINVELEWIKNEMQKLLDSIELKKLELINESRINIAPTPVPTPGGSRGKEDDAKK